MGVERVRAGGRDWGLVHERPSTLPVLTSMSISYMHGRVGRPGMSGRAAHTASRNPAPMLARTSRTGTTKSVGTPFFSGSALSEYWVCKSAVRSGVSWWERVAECAYPKLTLAMQMGRLPKPCRS